ncbi:NADP-dependent oxidoreductase [Longispora albida]|uniref:NADP-dependent oxidoreductase n=1 Tax=Longispora albida TaxID=203523 RepID=UPI000364FA6E|nr:NADP-dependent oxidoreductase [Longispora albida]
MTNNGTNTATITFSEYGAPAVLALTNVTELPQPGAGQVRLKVRAAGVNPADWKIRAGLLSQFFPITFPHVPGLEAAGIVDAVGEGVTEFAVGDEVFGMVEGGYAGHAIADVIRIAAKPATLTWEVAGALGVAADAAHRALDSVKLTAGETVLIHAAAGGVGSLAVQFAVAAGAKVIGTASTSNHDYLRALGAIPVEYGDGLLERVQAIGTVDAVVDASGRGVLPLSVELTGGTERVITIADPTAAEHGVRFSSGHEPGDERYTREALDRAVALPVLELPIWKTYPLAEAAEAHRDSEHGHHRGKLVLVP